MNKCKNCGTEFEGKFCPECGTAANAKPICPNCGGELSENVKFCPNCGCNLASPQAAQPKAVAQPQVAVNIDWRKIIKYLPLVFFSLWAVLLWAFYAAPVMKGDGFFIDTVNLYGVLKDEMMSDMYSATNSLIAFAVIADVYAVLLGVVYIRGSKRLRNIFTYASFALHIAIVICAAVFGSALNTYLEGFEENVGNLVAVVIALTVVFAFLQIVSVVLVRKFPAAEQEPKQRQPRAKSQTPSKAKQWFSAHKALVAVLLVVLVLGATLGTVLPITLGNIFRANKVDNIQLGDGYAQVENILGEPTSSTEYQYLYYSKNAADLLKEMEQIQKQAETATNFSQLNKLQSQMEKLEEELKTLEYKFIQVTFSDGKVTSVLLNTKATNNSQNTAKETKSISLSEIPLNAKPEYATIYATIYYADGSYKLYAISNITRTKNRQVSWQDDFGTYTADIKYGNEIGVGSVLNVTLDPNGGTLADGESLRQQVVFGYEFSLPVSNSSLEQEAAFDGWYLGNRKITDSTGQGVSIWDISETNSTLIAKYEYRPYNIEFIFDSTVGDFETEPPYNYTIEGLTLPKLVCKNNGHYLVGWTSQSGKMFTDEIPQGTKGDLILTAVWGGEHNYGSNARCTICNKLSFVSDDYKTVAFGTYPQSKVNDTALQSMLNAEIQNKLPSSDNANGWTDYGYYISGKVQSYMWYVDVNYQNEKYRGVYFTNYRPHYTTSSSSTGNTYQNNNGYNTNTVYWFKWEPITWRILNNAGGKALIMADLIIDSQQFYHENSGTRTIDGKTVYPNNYKESDIRKWLNDDFYNAAFDELSKDFVIQTEVDNSASTTSSSNNQYACENTLDNVFLLSYKEAANSSYGLNSSIRQLKTTDYAQCQGANTATGSYQGFGWWWLRSPYSYYSYYAYYVAYDGTVYVSNRVDYTRYGVVPALNITL